MADYRNQNSLRCSCMRDPLRGLGLAIAREIARAHGGDIYAASDAGLTSFTIWIPQGPSVAVRAPSAS